MMSESEEELVSGAGSISFTYVPFEVIHHLAMLLDPPIVARCKDWKGLADKLGYIAQEIYMLESRQTTDGSNTKKLFNEYLQHPGNNVGDVMMALKELERQDAYEVLLEALPDIRRKKTDREMAQRKPGDPQQNSCNFPSMGMTHPMCSGYMIVPSMCSHMTPEQYMSMHRRPSDPMFDQNTMLSHPTLAQRSLSGGSVCIANNGNSYTNLQCIPTNGERPRGPVGRNNSFSHTDMEVDDGIKNSAPQRWTRQQSLEMPGQEAMFSQHMGHSNGQMDSDMSTSSLPSLTSVPTQGPRRSPVEATWDSIDSHVNNNNNDTGMSRLHNGQMLAETSRLQSPTSPSSEPSASTKGIDRSFPTRVKLDTSNRPGTVSGSETFPKGTRDKQRSEIPKALRGVQEERTLVAQYRSISEPRNVSPAPFGTARRETRVFITYASDSREHLNRIMAAANNLRKNGFAVSCDMYEKEFVDFSEDSRDKWLRRRYTDADFILVCISPLYYQQVQTLNNSINVYDRSMHEAFIYKMMEHEAQVNGNVSRFICMLFKNSSTDHIPPLLQNKVPVYQWPNQYKDLFFKLIKPEQILTSIRTSLPSTQSSLDPPSAAPSGSRTSTDTSNGVRNPVIIRREVT